MKHIVLVALGAFAVVACGAADESEYGEAGEISDSTSEALVNQFTPYVSEEQPAGTTCGTDATAATQAGCSGSYCDNMRLFCGTLPAGFAKTGTGAFTATYVSDEQPGGLFCPPGQIIDGIRARGRYADDVSVRCSPATFPTQGVNCKFTPWFSEEGGGNMVFDVNALSYAGAVATGVRCSGSYCDNLSFYVCEPKCTSNSDCFDACASNGQCTVG